MGMEQVLELLPLWLSKTPRRTNTLQRLLLCRITHNETTWDGSKCPGEGFPLCLRGLLSWLKACRSHTTRWLSNQPWAHSLEHGYYDIDDRSALLSNRDTFRVPTLCYKVLIYAQVRGYMLSPAND